MESFRESVKYNLNIQNNKFQNKDMCADVEKCLVELIAGAVSIAGKRLNVRFGVRENCN